MSFSPCKRKFEVALLQHLVGVAAHRFPCAHVPNHDSARAIVAFGDSAFEIEVGNRMILHLHGEALVGWIERRTFGNSPRFQHAIHFQAEVIVKAGCSMLLHDEAMTFFRRDFTGRFRGAVELAFALIFFESHRKKSCQIRRGCCQRAEPAASFVRLPPLLYCQMRSPQC